jgi:hypothetical protein
MSIFFGCVILEQAQSNFLALLWRERIEVRVVRSDFALTLALSRIARIAGEGIDDRNCLYVVTL